MDFSLQADQEAFVARARAFARDRVAAGGRRSIDEAGEYPRALVAEAAALGLMGVTIPVELGGAGRDYVTYALAMEADVAGQRDAGRDSERQQLAGRRADPGARHREQRASAGCAAGQRRSDRRLCAVGGQRRIRCGESGSHGPRRRRRLRHLNGTKVWVANAEVADVAIVFAVDGSRRAQPRHQRVPGPARRRRASPAARRRIRSACAVSAAWTSSSTTCECRAGARIGEAGRGFRLAMRALEGGRIAIAAQALGIGLAALDEALEYARRREAFGQTIGSFQAIQFQLADLATDLEAARMLMWRAASHARSCRTR